MMATREAGNKNPSHELIIQIQKSLALKCSVEITKQIYFGGGGGTALRE